MSAPVWIKNNIKNPYFFDGDDFIVSVTVKNNKTGVTSVDVDRIRCICDEDRLDWVYSESGESFDKWQWEDVEYYIPLNAEGPMGEEQIRACT